MDVATVTLDALAGNWPLPAHVPAPDGYARPALNLTAECPACGKLSAVAFDHARMMLVACCTDKERVLL